MKKTKQALFHSVIALLLCCSMLIGTSFAWFTDEVTTGTNIIQSGNLDVKMYWTDDLTTGVWYDAEDASAGVPFDYDLWEPGYTEVRYVKIVNAGNLALKYQLTLAPVGTVGKLAEVIDVYYAEDVTENIVGRSLTGMNSLGVLKDTINGGKTADGALQPGNETVVALALKMDEQAGNDYQNETVGDGFVLKLLATQQTAESDSFGDDYDADAKFPGANVSFSASTSVADAQQSGALTQDVTVGDTSGDIYANVPAGVQLADGAQTLTLTVETMESSGANLTLENDQAMASLDVHMDGVAEGNTVPMIINLGAVLPVGLNMGNYELYHVENGATEAMTRVDTLAELDDHNEFYYDPATGNVTVALATFSEVVFVAGESEWTGNVDHTWYDAEATELTIANADQLWSFSQIVGGMVSDINQDSFSGKTVKLICNINLADDEDNNVDGKIFYPIGYYNDEGTYEKTATAITSGFKTFEGTFDGNGHTISNFYQNTWEMKGDHNWYDASLQYYRDGMGLFGKVYGGTVKNLTVKNFSSDGEITTTGVIAAYADCGATFENIAIFNCNPRVYNIGNGGIVGCVGWYANDTHTEPVTFRNITVDNTNKISALWGSWDVACGGLVGQYYPTSGQENAIDNGGIYMENCHVAAQIDVYNDVCANYQYYAYRYAGILIGSVRENVEVDGHVYPNMEGITAKDCTVHFGDWNDYYYCELVANSLASYTHDHQMSRLEQVKSVDLTNMKVTTLDDETVDIPTSGAANYVVVKATDANGMWIHGDGADYATCYHFVDGNQHSHEDYNGDGDADYETVDGRSVLVEDKQLVYREFNNLVTGYGWGVTSKGIDDMDGVTILDREEGNSCVKFAAQDSISDTYRANNERAIGKLFKAAEITDPNLSIKSENVVVTVSPKVGTDSTAGGIYTPNADDWTKGTIVFTGAGDAVITITDYYYCIATTVEVEVVKNGVTGISVKTNKNIYDISKNETFSADDITVTAVYSDGNARTLDVSEYTYEFLEGSDSDFTVFGQKTANVTYTYAEDTVTTQFVVFAVNMQELTLAGGTGEYPRYFQQFGVNAVGQNFFTAPGTGVSYTQDDIVTEPYEAVWTFGEGAGTATYTAGFNGGSAIYKNADGTYNDSHGEVVIECETAPFVDIFGYVGYADREPIAFGVYVDTIDNLTYTLPMDANADINALTGSEYSKIFYIQAPLNTMNLSAGEQHTVTFVSIFADGIQTLTEWKVNIAEKEEVDISTKTANVIILAGQSNAYGASALTETVKAQAVTADYSNIFINYSNINCENEVWKSLYYNAGFESYHPGVGGTVDGLCFGPEVGIAYQLATNEATKDEVWYIIKYTAAGSVLDGQWLDGTYDNYGLVEDMGGHLSDLMIDYIHDSLAKIEAIHGDNINIHSFAWMQGESDALVSDAANKYQANEAALVNKVRTEFASYANNGNGDNIIFISGGIAKYATIDIALTGASASNGWVCSDTVNGAKQTNAWIDWDPITNNIAKDDSSVLSNSAFIDTSSLLVGANAGENTDVYHYSSTSMWSLGNWFGIAINYIAPLIS